MTSLLFSTGYNRSAVEDIPSSVFNGLATTKSTMPIPSFPQFLPHPHCDNRNSVFSGIAAPIHFSTGSTTNTKNMNQRFCVVVVIVRQHSTEVENAIQR